ncbi:MAG: endolytic transglycosylase MltG [Patescibacteria group bacterium]
MNKVIKVSSLLFILILLVTLLGFHLIAFALNKKNVDGNTFKTIEIKKGMRVSEIGKLLREEKLINSATLFSLYVRYKGISPQAGVYQIKSDLSLVDVSNELRLGVDDVKITIIEGLRSEEIAKIIKNKLSNFNDQNFLIQVRDNNLEGKLFPDTYLWHKTANEKDVLTTLAVTFTEKTTQLFKENETGLSDKELLTLASIVEREEWDPKEMPIVAGILITRLKRGELLGADATTQYAFGNSEDFWPKNLTQEQIDSVNPFNTRKVAGLPPHPISNPGLYALKATLKYEQTSYNYYLHDKEGKVHYARNYDEHLMNISKYLN